MPPCSAILMTSAPELPNITPTLRFTSPSGMFCFASIVIPLAVAHVARSSLSLPGAGTRSADAAANAALNPSSDLGVQLRDASICMRFLAAADGAQRSSESFPPSIGSSESAEARYSFAASGLFPIP